MTRTATGYSSLSIALHWIAAIAVIALFFTHEGDRGSLAQSFHIAGGAVIGLLLVWRSARRLRLGFTAKPNQPAILNLLSSMVIWGLLAAMVVVVVTGYALPWTLGRPLDFAGFVSIPSPIGAMPALHEVMEEAHDAAGHVIMLLVIVHVAGALKHAVIDRDGIMARMKKPVSGGI